MNIEIIITAIISALIGIAIFLIYIFKHYKKKIVGTIIIDPINPEVNGGIYTVWDIDPFKLENGQLVVMDVLVYNVGGQSQEEQGS